MKLNDRKRVPTLVGTQKSRYFLEVEVLDLCAPPIVRTRS
jgi:hypothetical protein